MGHFISQASDEIQGLFRLNANTMEEFQATVQYFGEDSKKVTTTELFGVFADFITKFEVSLLRTIPATVKISLGTHIDLIIYFNKFQRIV